MTSAPTPCAPAHHKLVIVGRGFVPALFDLRQAPCESKDLAGKFPDMLHRLDRQCTLWEAPLVTPFLEGLKLNKGGEKKAAQP